MLAGGLGPGGAEKQLVYMARALSQAGVTVRVYSLTQGDVYEAALQTAGITTIWVGRLGSPPLRAAAFTSALRGFRPHIIHAGHFFTNLYVSLAAKALGAVAIGTVRSDAVHELATHGGWGRWLLRVPPDLLVNSWQARHNIESMGLAAERVHVLPNVLDVAAFDARASTAQPAARLPGEPCVAAVGRLVPAKRFDYFLRALALARRRVAGLRGVVVGEGPERAGLESLAGSLGLLPDGVTFLGLRADTVEILNQVDLLALSSDHEGFPNVLLEAMAASRPVITTPAGDAARVVDGGRAGLVVVHGDVEGMAERMVQLGTDPELRQRLGAAGRARVEQLYDTPGLASRLLEIYGVIARLQSSHSAARAVQVSQRSAEPGSSHEAVTDPG
jgi:glycosyltransferase involved in cell wall biosynthesis